MPNAYTHLSDVINPEVMGNLIEAKIAALCKLIPYAKVDNTLVGVPGDTKTVPCWNYIGDASDFDVEAAADAGTEMETTKLTADKTTFTIKCAGKSVSILQTAINSGLGDPVGQANIQLAKSIVGKTDNDLMAAIVAAADAATVQVVGTGSAAIGYDGLVDAITKFLDEEDGIDKVVFIHPEQEATLLKDDDFLSADKFQAGVAVNGAIGKIAGAWVKKSKKVVKRGAVSAVAGVYTVTIAGNVASGDKITVLGVTTTLDSTSGASVSAAATAVKNALAADTAVAARFTLTVSNGVITLTEKSGKEGGAVPTASVVAAATNVTATVATTTAGVAAASACYMNPIIKLEPDDAETEYTEDELPALTIFMKKDTQVDHEWFPKKQRHDITAAKYYGVAVTNAAKVVVAKFGVSA